MSYVALYRKYRPINFSDMVGQEHITKIIKNQIDTNKISHAYIFSGTRGTGKTTAAKIFARAINCLDPKDGEPCNKCEACLSVLEGNTTDVVEMDAASNNSVENIRSIRQEVSYSTTGLKYKVYIIDEAHMLSTSAFNALLKTLEEPPENVVFILATTEEHKILPTILSRCIRFEFKKISNENIVKRLSYVIQDLGIDCEASALKMIADLADGGMRDALSILERCVTSSESKITKASVEELVGTVPKNLIDDIVLNILKYDILNVQKITNELIDTGKDLRNISSYITEEFLSILVKLTTKEFNEDESTLNDVLKDVSVTRVYEIIKQLSKLDDDLRQSNNTSLIFKAKLLELATNVVPLNEDELIKKIHELELKVEKLEMCKFENTSTAKNLKPKEENIVIEKEEVKKEKDVKLAKVKTSKEKLKQLDKIMKKAIEIDNLKLYSALAGAEAYKEDEETVVFATKNAFAYGVLNKDNTKEDLRKIVNDELNGDCNIKIEYIKENDSEVTNEFENLVKDSGVPFEVID